MATILPDFDHGDVLTEKRKTRYFPRKLQPIKNGFLGNDFPSKVRLASVHSGLRGEDFGEIRSETSGSAKQPCFDKPPIEFWRIADCHDEDKIFDLIEKSNHLVDDIFSAPDISDLIEKSAFAFVQFNSKEEMVSFTCVFAYPNIPAVPSFEWYVWIERMYHSLKKLACDCYDKFLFPRIDDISPRNCFFIHYMVWRTEYHEEFLGVTLETMFMEFPFLKYIILIKPPLVKIPEIMADYFIPVLPKDIHKFNWDSNSVQTMLLCIRHTLLERLKIRLAMVEDHDDLMPIIERQTGKLRELYGDFCMAEIIEYPGTDDRKTLVCEVLGYAVAFMNLNRSIDLELLNTQFDLGVFHGLRKPTEDDKNAEVLEEGLEKVVYLPEKLSPSLDVINSDTMENIFHWKPTICEAQDDLVPEDKSEESVGSGDLPPSVIELIRESTEAKLAPKFSAYVLGSPNSDTRTSAFSEFGEAEESVKTELSLISLQYYNLPEYHGPSNAFCIELFAVHEDFDEKLCSDFLEAAFELFPDLEYCLLTIPSQCVAFPLLDLFVRVTPRPLKRFKQELYVCHRSSVMITFMRVRRIVKSDLKEIYDLLKGIKNREFIYADIANSCIYPDSAYQGFVLICNQAIVGVAVVCNENGLEYLTEHYHVGDLIDFDLHKIDYHAVLKHLTLSPIFQTHARFFLRDIMRMADITALYRARYEERKSEWNTSSLITVLGQLVPVKPRRMVKYHQPSLGQNLPPPYLLNYDLPFALYHINSRICGLRKFTSNINLVIVGTSRTAFSFLENLLYASNSAYVTYNNITWVSPHGTGSELASHQARDLIFPYRGKYNRRYKAQISLHSFVNIVYGVMTEINRKDKYITINNDAILRYDYLLLLCGRQYKMPVPLVRELDVTRCNRGDRPRCSLFKYLINQKVIPTEEGVIVYPSNVFLINSVVDATNAIISLQYLMRKRRNTDIKENIIIYGQDLIVYLCVQSLLKFDIPPELIVLVEPPSKNFSSEKVFMDPNIDAAVLNILCNLNIKHYRDYVLYDWSLCDNNQIGTVTFHSKHHKIRLNCMAMFPFEEKLVSDRFFLPHSTWTFSIYMAESWIQRFFSDIRDHFSEFSNTSFNQFFYTYFLRGILKKRQKKYRNVKEMIYSGTVEELNHNLFAVNEASLVYDGRLVINYKFQTNDPYIYSAGPFTKYQRKYYANDKNHEFYDSTEVGKLLAEIIRGSVDPTEEDQELGSPQGEVVPTLNKPVLVYGQLPGDWNYFQVRKPGKLVPLEVHCNVKEYGDTLITGDCEMSNGYGYFRLHLDDFGFVRDITCFTKDEIDIENLPMLYGKHEKYLNNLLIRFNLGMITDFFSFFRQPWVYALYHDRFKLLMNANSELFSAEKSSGKQRIIDMIDDALKDNKWDRPDEYKLTDIREMYDISDVKQKITKNVVDYLKTFDEAFPMYATSGILRVLLHGASTSLLHESLFRDPSGVEYKPAIKISDLGYNF